jgi:hypothetical protein
MPTLARLLLVMAVTGALATGCGPDAEDRREAPSPAGATAYETSVRSIHADMNEAMAAAFAPGDLDAARVGAAEQTARRAAAEMESAQVPKRYDEAHAEYARGLATFVEILGDVEAQVNDPNVARRHLQDERFATGVGHLERASQLYEDAGLDLDAAP